MTSTVDNTVLSQLNSLASTFYTNEQFDLAAQVCDVAANYTQNTIPEILLLSSLCHRKSFNFEQALKKIKQYSKIVPDDNNGYIEQAFCLRWLGRYAESNALANTILSNTASGLLTQGWHKMQQGEFSASIALTEAGRGNSYWSANRKLPLIPRLPNNNLKNQRILICGESGHGDEIIFARWINDLKKEAAYVEYYTDNSLGRVFARQFDIKLVNDPKETTCDYYVPMMSLAHITSATAPGTLPYLTPCNKALAKWKERLKELPQPLIAINANGDLTHPEHYLRSVDWNKLGQAMSASGQLINVQKNLSQPLPENVIDLSKEIENWDDTLAILEICNLTVTVCTSIAHASSALGKPTIVLTTPCDYFTWCATKTGKQSDWYKQTWVIRQQKIGCWDEELLQASKICESLIK